MKIAITSTGKEITDLLEKKFGRAEFFIIADTENSEYKVIDNKAAMEAGGAGIQAGQTIIEEKATALITGNVGPNAMKVLTSGNIAIYRGESVSVEANISLFKQKKLQQINTAVASHFGMK
ncbi:MAG: NifB/NifX family molybdenum-iron cluster-binding protein [Clostridiales bacterium]|nr:NifB/NifX family molybdenum-iron cluster-binding protein [Clostridiales bacterium]